MVTRPSFRRTLLLVLTGILLWAIGYAYTFWPYHAWVDAKNNPIGADFINFWAAPLVGAHDIGALFALARYNHLLDLLYGTPISYHFWSYPPTALPLLVPFALMPYVVALGVWTLLGIIAYRWIAHRLLPPSIAAIGVVLALLGPASLVNFFGGQNGYFTAALFLGALFLLKPRPIVAGILLGLLSVKPQLCVLWPFALLALGAWRTLFTAALTAALLALVTTCMYGPDVWHGFFDATLALQWQFTSAAPGHEMYQLMVVSAPLALQMASMSMRAAFIFQAVLFVIVALFTVIGLRRAQRFDTRALLLASGTALASPYVMSYDLAALSLVLLWRLLDPPEHDPRGMPYLYALGFFVPALVVFLNIYHLPLSPLILAALFIYALKDSYSQSRRKRVRVVA